MRLAYGPNSLRNASSSRSSMQGGFEFDGAGAGPEVENRSSAVAISMHRKSVGGRGGALPMLDLDEDRPSNEGMMTPS